MSRVAVLKGGSSLERQVSLRSGARVEDALGRLGHETVAIDVGEDLIDRVREEQPEIAFVALHGRDGEDGTVQELLEIVGLPYTGSGVLACMRSIDKVLASTCSSRPTSRRPSSSRSPRPRSRRSAPRTRCPRSRSGSTSRSSSSRRPAGRRSGSSSRSRRRPCRRRSCPGSRTTRACCWSATSAGRDLAVSIVEGADGPEALPIVEAVPARRGLLRLRGPLRDRPHGVRLPGPGARRGHPPSAGAGARRLPAARPVRVRPRRPDARGGLAVPLRARGQRDPRA